MHKCETAVRGWLMSELARKLYSYRKPGAGKPASLADCFYWSSGKLTIHKYTPERRTERPHSANSTHTGHWHCTHGIAHDKHSVRWHCHGRVKSACDDADDGTAVAVWAHAGQHAKGSREERGRSLLLLLLPVFPRRFHVVLAAFFLRSFPLTMKIDPLKDGDACQTHDECSEEREARAVHTINSARAGICEERGEEGHMLGAGRCEWHVRAAREVRDAGRCRTVQSERASAKRASESARIQRGEGRRSGLRATSCSRLSLIRDSI
jgi:hypothetical protein